MFIFLVCRHVEHRVRYTGIVDFSYSGDSLHLVGSSSCFRRLRCLSPQFLFTQISLLFACDRNSCFHRFLYSVLLTAIPAPVDCSLLVTIIPISVDFASGDHNFYFR